MSVLAWLMNRQRDASKAELEDLIVHCWVHSGYPNCGYNEMTTKQKCLYDSVVKKVVGVGSGRK